MSLCQHNLVTILHISFTRTPTHLRYLTNICPQFSDKRAVAYCAGSPIAQEGNKRAVAYCDGNPEALEQPTKRGVSYYRHHLYWDTKEEKKRSVSSYGPHTFWDAKEEK